jgi:hypothetical protein
VQLSGGRVIGHRLRGVGNQIDHGGTYLMFLNYKLTADCFTIVKMWGFGRRSALPDHVFGHTGLVDGEAQFEQLTMDVGRSR